MAQSLVRPDDFLEEAEVLRRWPMLTARELKRARKANPPLIGFYNFSKSRGGPRYTPQQVQEYLDRTYLRIAVVCERVVQSPTGSAHAGARKSPYSSADGIAELHGVELAAKALALTMKQR